MFLELPGQFEVGTIVLRHDDDAGGVLIDTVHDTRPNLAANAGEIVAVGQERVHQGSVGISGTGMHRHSGDLVHHNQIAVLVKDREGNLFGLGHGSYGGRDLDEDLLAALQFLGRPGRGTIHRNHA